MEITDMVVINVVLILAFMLGLFIFILRRETVIKEIEEVLEQPWKRFSLSGVRKGYFEGVAFSYSVTFKNVYEITLKVPCKSGVVFYIEKGTLLERLFGKRYNKDLEDKSPSVAQRQRDLISNQAISRMLSDLTKSFHFKALEINGKEAILKLNFKKGESFNELKNLLSTLISFAKQTETFYHETLTSGLNERRRDLISYLLWSLPLILAVASFAGSMFIQIRTGKNFEIIEPSYFPRLVLYFVIPPHLCYLIVAFKILKEKPLGIETFRKVLVALLICAISFIPAIFVTNGLFDRSSPSLIDTIVENKTFRPKGKNYLVRLRPISPALLCFKKKEALHIHITLSPASAKNIIPYDTRLRLYVKKGALGFCWLDRFEIIRKTGQ